MNTRISYYFAAVVALMSSQFATAVAPTSDETAQSRQWAETRWQGGIAGDTFEPFFSFVYGDKPSSEFLKTCDVKRASRKLDENRMEHTLVYTDSKTGLVVRCVGIEYSDYPCVEWILHFKNTGEKDTPILADIQSLDIRIERKPGTGEFLLHHNAGTQTQPSDYEVRQTVLGPGVEKIMMGAGGCPTVTDLSCFNLELSRSEGVIVAVGWPGQLAIRLNRDKESGLRIRAGQELTHFKLLPGEEVRTPLVALQFWKGEDWLRAQNVWRRWFIAHNIRKPGGKLPPTGWTGAADAQGIMDKSTAALAKQYLNAYFERGLKPDVWWMDAGWYPCGGAWPNTGTWEVDKARFPQGLREVTDILHKNGMKAVLWFEPERVTANSWLPSHHPEWILGGKNGTLVDFGNPEAWKWIVNRVDELLVSENVDIYRQDFNMCPLDSWRANDAKDRQGITEIRHVTGLLAYWDELLRRHPEMLYDNCAGGGRRNDLESMRRGVAYCKSDYALEPVGVQCETYGLAMWYPCFGASWGDSDDAYICRSNMAHLVGACVDVNKKDHYRDGKIVKRLDEWRKTTAHFWGDFWPLTPYSLDNKAWIAWQFDEPEEGEGVVQAFRRAESSIETMKLKMRGLNPEAIYVLTNLDAARTTEATGKNLMEDGLDVVLKRRPEAAIVTYKKKS
jgi:alpha-galactosidase